MKKTINLFTAGLLFLLSTGCNFSTLETAPKFNDQQLTVENTRPIAHINSQIWGIYLLTFIPIVAGNPDNPGEIVVFQDTISEQGMIRNVTRHAKAIGANATVDLYSWSRGDWGLRNSCPYLPLWMIPMLFGGIWIRQAQACGNAVKTIPGH